MQTHARAEYVARINRVIDHIDRHLGDPLTLDELAGVAAFSPFYFHRIFAALVGETPAQYVRRLRVERAAQQLIASPRKPVTAIALDCGFSGSAPFARAFKETLGMTASEWRRTMAARNREMDEPGGQHRKDRQAPGKPCKDWEVTPSYGDAARQRLTWRVTMVDQNAGAAAQTGEGAAAQTGEGAAQTAPAGGGGLEAQVEVQEAPAFTLAYVRHTGPYAGDGELFGRLFGRIMGWTGSRGLLGPQSRVVAVYHDNPGLTEPDKLRVSVGVSVPDDTPVEGEIGKMVIPGGTWAVARFELTDADYSAAWDAVFCGWLPDSGYQPTDGVCYEQYLNDPAQHPEHKSVVNICVPVKPL